MLGRCQPQTLEEEQRGRLVCQRGSGMGASSRSSRLHPGMGRGMRFVEQSQLPSITPGAKASGQAIGWGTHWLRPACSGAPRGSCGRLEPAGADAGRRPHSQARSVPYPPEHSSEVKPLSPVTNLSLPVCLHEGRCCSFCVQGQGVLDVSSSQDESGPRNRLESRSPSLGFWFHHNQVVGSEPTTSELPFTQV